MQLHNEIDSYKYKQTGGEEGIGSAPTPLTLTPTLATCSWWLVFILIILNCPLYDFLRQVYPPPPV